MGVFIDREEDAVASRRLLEDLTTRLPEWFGQPESNRHYAYHRQGIGQALVGAIEGRLRQEGLKYLFVMTLHPNDPYEPYRRTRAFYERLGF